MNLLALDTSSDACSVALRVGDDVVDEHVVKAREHTQILIPMVRSLLGEAGVELQDLAAIVLGNGPGSFIGMRIAASVAQGLAFGSGLKIVPVSSLAAVAAEVIDARGANHVIVAQDARMKEAYLGIYRKDEERLPVAVSDEVLQPIEKIALPAELDASGWVVAGKAWQRYPEFLQLNREIITEVADIDLPKARYLLTLGARGWQDGAAIEPAELVPAYLRMKVARRPMKTVTEL